MTMRSPREWLTTTACGKNGDDWYPEKPKAQMMARKAKQACNGEDGIHPRCPIIDECLEWAMETGQRWGIWGGLSERERNRLRIERKKEAALLAPVIQLDAAREAKVQQDKATRFAANKPKKSTTAQRAPESKAAARFVAAKKEGGLLLPGVKRHLQARLQDEDRHHELIHVSELAKNDWCPRATYKRIAAVRAGNTIVRDAPHFTLDNIWEEGDRIHAKWQARFWDMGLLWGEFRCHACGWTFSGQAPSACPQCEAPRGALQYREVVMEDPESLIVAHADGEIRGDAMALIEIKSIGQGTVRVEAPAALAKHSHKYTDNGVERTHLDHDGLWRDLRRPFNSHLRQSLLYLYLRKLATERRGWPEVKRIVLIYEYKPTQAVKEFPPVTLDREGMQIVEEIIGACKDIVYALDNDHEVMCKNGRRAEPCAACKEMDQMIGGGHEAQGEARRADDGRPSDRRREGLSLASSTGDRTLIARRPDRARRRGADGSARPDHSLGGLLAGAAGDGVRRRARR